MPEVAVVNPVPLPLRIPDNEVVTARVPAPVTGLPETVNPLGIDKPTDVTLPPPAVVERVRAEDARHDPTVTLLNPPDPFP